MILLVVDTQNLIMNNDLFEFQTFVYRIKTLIKEARNNDIEVIYVRHDDGVGEKLTKGALGYEIYEEFQPMPNERIFDKNVNSAFRDTGLLLKLLVMETITGKHFGTIRSLPPTIKHCMDIGLVQIIKPLLLLHISMIVAPLQSLAHIRSKPLMFPPTGRIRKSPFPLTLLLRLPTTHDKRYCYVSAAHSFLSPYDEKLYSKF